MSPLRILNATLLVAGTCIGGGMLALPVMSGRVGFIPAISVMGLAWIFMTLTGLLYLEANLWLKKDNVHLISLSSELLGNFAKNLCWVIYLFIGFASLVAYIAGSGMMMQSLLAQILPFAPSLIFAKIIYVTLFSLIIFFGTAVSSSINSFMTISMFSLFFLLIGISAHGVSEDLILRQSWDPKEMIHLLPILLTTFSYPGIVPVLVEYLEKDVKKIRLSIILGTSCTFLAYTVWMFIVLGKVPFAGAFGLEEALRLDLPASVSLQHFSHSPLMGSVTQIFAFLAIGTSFLGISLSVFNFLADGLKIPKQGSGKIILCLLVAIPSLLIDSLFEQVFFKALNLSGGIGDAILSGLIPASMVWVGRSKFPNAKIFRVFGGKTLLLACVGFYSFILLYEVSKLIF